jgi:hypothetical protein
LLDSGEIDYAILDVLEMIVKSKKKSMQILTHYAHNEFLYFPIIRALLDVNIMYKMKYHSIFHPEHYYYNDLI